MSLNNQEIVDSHYHQTYSQIDEILSDEYSTNYFPRPNTFNTIGKQYKSDFIGKESQYDAQFGSSIGWQDITNSLTPTFFEVSESNWNFHPMSILCESQQQKQETTNSSDEQQRGSILCDSCKSEPHCLSCQKKSISIQQIQKKIIKHKVEKKNVDFSIRKNFPKLLGTHLLNQIEQFPNSNIPEGIQQFRDNAVVRKQAKLQQSFAIEDFRRICLNSEESKEYFIDFILNKFIVRLMHSSKFTQIDLVLDLIRNAYVGACNPQQWKGNMQIDQA
ncbi:unnamed protein product [Paramecium pentaurelia]|uniref:Uncharacterized protein n=1 Tax=Paramecium pentaurelia TaxID=43138 RepID=A0A8S1Y463_9CILI|nr:unnamed protein product [Paramecium pentaurelia]